MRTMNAFRAVLPLFLLVCTLACDSSPPPPSEPAKPTVEAKLALPVPEATPASPRASTLDVTLVRALLDRWIAAQNRGDFAGYSALYATRMYGEKRAGTRLYKYDRKGWLDDRKRMFTKPMTVSAEEVEISSEPLTASVTFEQAFAQGNFQDRGPKRMTLVKEDGELRISTELMLASTLAQKPAEAAKDFFFVVKLGEKSHAILQEGAPREWGTGAPSAPFEPQAGAYAVLQATHTLPAEQAAFGGRPLRVYAADGSSCDANVGTLKLMAAVIPHFGTVQSWSGQYDASGNEVAEAKRVPEKPETIAAQLLAEVNDADLSLVGELSGCHGLFATSPERNVQVFPAATADADAQAAAEQAFKRLSLYKRALGDYSKAMREAPEEPVAADWPERTSTSAFGPKSEYLVVVGARGAGCGDYSDSMATLMRSQGGVPGEVVSARNASMPALVIDLDRDGTMELVMGSADFAGRALQRFVKSEAIDLRRVPVSFHDCGC
jgi:hypothetical protein